MNGCMRCIRTPRHPDCCVQGTYVAAEGTRVDSRWRPGRIIVSELPWWTPPTPCAYCTAGVVKLAVVMRSGASELEAHRDRVITLSELSSGQQWQQWRQRLEHAAAWVISK